MIAFKKCPFCGSRIKPGTKICPKCKMLIGTIKSVKNRNASSEDCIVIRK